MNIRHTEDRDLPALLEIYAGAREYMKTHGNPRQWAEGGWPPDELVKEDIEKGRSYTAVNDRDEPEAVFVFLYGSHIDPTYEVIEEGSWPSTEVMGEAGNTYGVIHRLASRGRVRGAGAFCIAWCYDQCRHLRADTHPDNAKMRALLVQEGFVPCGIIHVEEDNDPRIAFEKFDREKKML